MKMEPIKFSFEQVEEVARKYLVSNLNQYKIFAFRGPLGAGKTTLIKAFLKEVGVKDVVTSPTFTYVKHYTAKTGKVFHHFDLYRLSSIESFLHLGFEEYLYEDNSVSVIEWPEVIADLLRQSSFASRVCFVEMNYVADCLEAREIQILTTESFFERFT